MKLHTLELVNSTNSERVMWIHTDVAERRDALREQFEDDKLVQKQFAPRLRPTWRHGSLALTLTLTLPITP